MYVKIYRYRLKPMREQEYLEIQSEAERIYSHFIQKQTLFLQSSEDREIWQEIHIYQDKKSYTETVSLVDQQPEIQVLYNRFLEVINSINEMSEEDYQLIDIDFLREFSE
ncbi:MULTISPECIES: hypothetical protein [Mesobacillus]|uniref:hypothetical protein n=1 Tax=Mesobacillus TaxID=2675231 RepID=UPI001786FEA7|nr:MULTISPECIES: hypothetical protein [Mesobacillus]MCM3572603.1 hypothetical protein [Mesobacillus subterraneus]UYZ23763.1 hypothetical protein FOF60_09600 [Mesobacillus jeotgali]